MQPIKEGVITEQLALNQINHWSKQFAGISSLAIFTPQGEKVCFDAMGNYQFTIPEETCKNLNIKP